MYDPKFRNVAKHSLIHYDSIKTKLKAPNEQYKLTVNDIVENKAMEMYPSAKYFEIAKQAVIDDSDELDINSVCEMYEKGKKAPPKYFSSKVFDNEMGKSDIIYKWLEPSNPEMYFIGNAVGTCMQLGDDCNALSALWESALSRDVKLCGIFSKSGQKLAYVRCVYDIENNGIIIDYVGSSRPEIANRKDVWEVVERAVKDMAKTMNIEGKKVKIVNFINYGENCMNIQFDRLPHARDMLKTRGFKHENLEYKPRDATPQKNVWKEI